MKQKEGNTRKYNKTGTFLFLMLLIILMVVVSFSRNIGKLNLTGNVIAPGSAGCDFNPADLNNNGIIDTNEANNYVSCWKTNCGSYSNVNIDYVTRAVYLANSGGNYICADTGNYPLKWISGTIIVPSPAIGINSCGVISQPGYYKLQNDVSTNGTCLTIQANNVILDLNGFTIRGSGLDDNPGYGVYANGYNSITIRNGLITEFSSTQGVGNFIWGSTGILLTRSSNNIISNISSTGNHHGIYLYIDASNNRIINNNISFNGNGGIRIQFRSNNNTMHNNIMEGDADGIYVDSSRNNLIDNNTFKNGGDIGVYLVLGSNNNFVTNNAIKTTNTGIVIELGSNNSLIANNVIESNNYFGIQLVRTSVNNTLLNNQILNNPFYSILSYDGINTNYLVYNNSYGEIRWTDASFLGNLTFKGNLGLGINLTLSSNFAEVNSQAFPVGKINSAANITLYGLPTTMINPRIYKSGVVCTDCYNFTSLNAGKVKFNVTSWGSYKIQ
ncbi:right-handed parallel beta-helix repeat-containing protein [Candidatus Pacearchaeota archaeon]|nr:right-handed parallel beta-helix repeat-containing protein [Candidatus Pacearchaeota archaeon]